MCNEFIKKKLQNGMNYKWQESEAYFFYTSIDRQFLDKSPLWCMTDKLGITLALFTFTVARSAVKTMIIFVLCHSCDCNCAKTLAGAVNNQLVIISRKQLEHTVVVHN